LNVGVPARPVHRECMVDTNKESLNNIFEQALAADTAAQNTWQVTEGGPWVWQHDGVRINNGGKWSALSWQRWRDFKSPALRNFVIEATVSGTAEAAGLSFGPYKDFLAGLDISNSPRHLQLEIDADVGCWAFRVDGQLMNRSWWDAKVKSVEDLLNGTLTLKAKNAETVLFSKSDSASAAGIMPVVCDHDLFSLSSTAQAGIAQLVSSGSAFRRF
jgi:hypothetical protein